MKKIAIVCGTGVATSTVVVGKVKTYLQSIGVEASIVQAKVLDIANRSGEFDLIIATTQIPSTVTTKTISGVPLLTGVRAEETYKQIAEALA